MSKYRVWRSPWYKRLKWWLDTHIGWCELVLITVALYMAIAVADAARNGRLGPNW